MVTLGYFLSSEEHGPGALVDQAARAEQAGFAAAWISDHFHPWTKEQGQSPFVWTVLGGIAGDDRGDVSDDAHPPGDCRAGRRDHGGDDAGPVRARRRYRREPQRARPRRQVAHPQTRLAMLEEAVAVIRELWRGEVVDHDGEHYVVENAQLFTRPDAPPAVLMSALGPTSVRVAARIADGYITTMPSRELLELYRSSGGRGPA